MIFEALATCGILISGTNERFVDFAKNAKRGAFTPSTNFFARSYDISCASPWNSASGSMRAGTAISKRHVILSNHFPLWHGVRIAFAGNDGQTCFCSIAKTMRIENTDLLVASLDYELTDNITPACILPEDYFKKIGLCKTMDVLTLNQFEQGVLTQLPLLSPDAWDNLILTYPPQKSDIRTFYKPLVKGDSGSPGFLLYKGQAILLYVDIMQNCGGGISLMKHRKKIQAAMDHLCPGYKLKTFSFE